ncbi:MAG: L-threonylcarbamoyladenylate synthase [Bacteroidia bacterium]|nr:L-threonylcarbamoyladenylate synthase [Bacteroidia bacterium]
MGYLTQTGTDLLRAEALLREGELVAVPTETVYGLAADATRPQAAARIFEVKQRPRFNPLIVHTDHPERVRELVSEWPPEAEALAKACWPGPLTLLLPRSSRIPDLVTAGSPRVAVRIPDHPLTLELLRRLPFPLAAPSANPFGYISPTTAAHVAAQLGGRIPYILDGGPARVGLESTIIGWEAGQPVLYRQGGIPAEVLEPITGPLGQPAPGLKPQAAGMLGSHYAPATPLILGDLRSLLRGRNPQRTGILSLRPGSYGLPPGQAIALSADGDLREAAQQFFAALRTLDALHLEAILAEPMPDTGLGRAINDRLRRAQAERKAAPDLPSDSVS